MAAIIHAAATHAGDHSAASYEFLGRLLLKCGAEVNTVDSDDQALHMAAKPRSFYGRAHKRGADLRANTIAEKQRFKLLLSADIRERWIS